MRERERDRQTDREMIFEQNEEIKFILTVKLLSLVGSYIQHVLQTRVTSFCHFVIYGLIYRN